MHDDEWVHDQRLRLDSGEEFVSEVWVEHAHPTTAEVIGRFVGGVWDERPAVLRHRLGKGQVWSVCATSLALQRHLLPLVAHEAGIAVVDHPFTDVATLPHLLDPARRWYFNYASEARTVGGVTIPPGDYVLA